MRNSKWLWSSAVLLAFSVGLAASPSISLIIEHFEASAGRFALVAALFIISCAVGCILAIILARWVLPIVALKFQRTSHALGENLANTLDATRARKFEEASSHATRLIKEAVSVYATFQTRQMIISFALLIFAGTAGVIGSMLLLTQNSLLRDQNAKIERQTTLLREQSITAQEQRDSVLTTELFDLLKAISEAASGEKTRFLKPSLAHRVVTLSRIANARIYGAYVGSDDDREPAQYVTTARPLSLERGRLISALSLHGIDLHALQKLGADFRYADLRGADLSGVDLSNLDLDFSDFQSAKLQSAKFQGSRLIWVTFPKADLTEADFSNARLVTVILQEAELPGSVFKSAVFEDGLELDGAVLRYTNQSLPSPIGLPTEGWESIPVENKIVLKRSSGSLADGKK